MFKVFHFICHKYFLNASAIEFRSLIYLKFIQKLGHWLCFLEQEVAALMEQISLTEDVHLTLNVMVY